MQKRQDKEIKVVFNKNKEVIISDILISEIEQIRAKYKCKELLKE